MPVTLLLVLQKDEITNGLGPFLEPEELLHCTYNKFVSVCMWQSMTAMGDNQSHRMGSVTNL